MTYILAIVLSAMLILVDQITKQLAVVNLKSYESVSIIDGVFELTFVENRGAAFGILQGNRWLFIAITVVIIIGIAVYFVKMPRTRIYNFMRIAIIVLASGAIGNFIDRIRQGYVVDFFYFSLINFPVFNFADIFIVTGTIALSIMILFFLDSDKKKITPEVSDDAE